MARRASKFVVPAIVGVPAVLLGTLFMAPSFAGTTEPVERTPPVHLVVTPHPATTLPVGEVGSAGKPPKTAQPQHPHGGCINCLNHHD